MKCKNFVIHSDDLDFFDTIYKKAIKFLNCKTFIFSRFVPSKVVSVLL